MPENLGGQAAVVFETGGGVGDVVFGFDDRLAAIARLQLGQRRGMGAYALGEFEEQPAAILSGSLRPRAGFEGSHGGGDGEVDIGCAGVRNFGDDFFGGGVVYGSQAPRWLSTRSPLMYMR